MKLIIFDCDGTLVDSQHIICAAMRAAFLRHGLPEPAAAAVRSVVGLSLPTAIRQVAPPVEGSLIDALAEAYKTAFGELRADAAYEEPLFPGARQALEALFARDDVVLGIATGKSRRGLDRVLEMHGLERYFSTVQTADIHPSKPHPAMIEYAMLETGTRAADTAMIGDTSYDMVMAQAAGVAAIGVGWGYHPAVDLETAGAHAIAADFPALTGVLDRLVLKREEAL